MNVIIIDDEPKARTLLQVLLEEHCPEIETIYSAEDLMSGIHLIKEVKPEIVFLDIEMPEHSGLEILNHIEKDAFNFEIVFTTAYSEYAVKAFQASAIDYLLKPLRPNQVKKAVDKVSKQLGKFQTSKKLEELKNVFSDGNFNKIPLPVSDGILFIDFNELITLKANSMYTTITTKSQGELLISKPLKHFVELLKDRPQFYRPHRSFLINLKYIKSFVKKDGGFIVMDNDDRVAIARDKRDEFSSIVNLD